MKILLLIAGFVGGIYVASSNVNSLESKIKDKTKIDFNIEKPVTGVVNTITEQLNSTDEDWWIKGADSLDMIYNGEELLYRMTEYVNKNIEYKCDATYADNKLVRGSYVDSYETVYQRYINTDLCESALRKHKGVCVGYSYCLTLMCEHLGVKVNCVSVPAHMVNVVRIGKKLYVVDPTGNIIYKSVAEYKNKMRMTEKFDFPEKFDYMVYYHTNNEFKTKETMYKDFYGGAYSGHTLEILGGKK